MRTPAKLQQTRRALGRKSAPAKCRQTTLRGSRWIWAAPSTRPSTGAQPPPSPPKAAGGRNDNDTPPNQTTNPNHNSQPKQTWKTI